MRLDIATVQDFWVAHHCRFHGVPKRLDDMHLSDLLLERHLLLRIAITAAVLFVFESRTLVACAHLRSLVLLLTFLVLALFLNFLLLHLRAGLVLEELAFGVATPEACECVEAYLLCLIFLLQLHRGVHPLDRLGLLLGLIIDILRNGQILELLADLFHLDDHVDLLLGLWRRSFLFIGQLRLVHVRYSAEHRVFPVLAHCFLGFIDDLLVLLLLLIDVCGLSLDDWDWLHRRGSDFFDVGVVHLDIWIH